MKRIQKRIKMPTEPKASTSKVDEKPKEEAKEPTIFKQIKYPPTGTSDKILEKLHASRKEGDYCDVQLKLSDTKTVNAHKSLLAVRSPYFEGMFGSAFLEATSDVIDLSHTCDRADVLEQVIDTFYGRQFEIKEENVSDVLNLATMLLIDDLKNICTSVLFGVVSVRNAAEVLQLAINFDLSELKEKVVPLVKYRFHDYIMFQDDLYDLSVEGFEFLINNIETKFIARRAKYIEFILKWFMLSETEERAKLLKRAVKRINFKITKRAYREIENQLEDVINHLDDANSDVSEELKGKVMKSLSTLRPKDYVKNPSPPPKEQEKMEEEIAIKGKKDDSDSELEDEPERELYNMFGAQNPVFGPPTQEQGFTREEEKKWEKAHADMADRDQHRIWAAKWPLDLLNSKGTHNDPERPKHIKRESSPEFFRSRNRRVKTEEELAEEAKLVEGVMVLAPSTSFLAEIEAKDQFGPFDDDMLDLSVYVPRKKAWYHIASVSAAGIRKFNNPQPKDRHGRFHRDPDDSDDDGDEMDEDEAFHLEAMMERFGPDAPEMVMMMMHGVPSSRRKRLMAEMMRGRIPMEDLMRGRVPSSLRRAMMDMDEDDFHRHEYMMMREMARMHRRRGPWGMGMPRARIRSQNIPSLTDNRWKFVYLKHRLYFCNDSLRDVVFCYDILTQNWLQSPINYEHESRDPKYQETANVDGLELIVMGQILYVVLRVIIQERREWHYRSKEEKIKESAVQELVAKHVVYKMVQDENSAIKWEKVTANYGHHVYIPVDEERREDPDRGERMGYFMDYYHDRGPYLKQPDGLKTIMYAEDEEKLYISAAVRQKYHKDGTVIYSIRHTDALYFDLDKVDSFHNPPDRQLFRRTLSPLFNDDVTLLVNDELEAKATINVGDPSVWHKVHGTGYGTFETDTEFVDALKKYPRCPSMLFSSGDGKNIWILRGSENDTSETIEVTATCCYQPRKFRFTKTYHPPPPYKCFTMTTVAKLDKTLIGSFGIPLKYRH